MATVKRVKKKEGEKLTDANIERVIELLEAPKPITKKDACSILNISYNTTRLGNIIEQYKAQQELIQKRRAANRGKPASPEEIQEVIKGYLDGDNIATISSGLYRPPNFVKNIIDNIGIPTRGGDYFHPELLPEQCISDSFEPGQVVWSTRYNAQAVVIKEQPNNKGYKTYQIYVLEKIEDESSYFPHVTGYGGRYATQAAFDLGSLDHLKSHGVDVYKPLRPYMQKWLAGR